MLKQLVRGAILAPTLLLVACATAPGAYNGLSKDPMASIGVHKNPLYGEMTPEDYKLAAYLAGYCKRDADQQMVSIAETMGTQVLTGGAGGASVGPAAGAAFNYAKVGPNALYGAIPGAVNGAFYGAQLQSSAKTAWIGSCVNGDLQDPKARAKHGGGLHAYPTYVRSTNTSGIVPSWVKPATARSTIGTSNEQGDSYTAPAPPPR